jgi:type IV pilus assembly protein PilB
LVLAELGIASEAAVAQALGRRLTIPWVSLYHVDFQRSLLGMVPRELAERHGLVPLFVRTVLQRETLHVATDDPTNDAGFEEVSRYVAMAVLPMIAAPSDIDTAIRIYYGRTDTDPTAPLPRLVPLPRPDRRSRVAAEELRPPPVSAHPPVSPVTPVPGTVATYSEDSDSQVRRARPPMKEVTLLDGTRLTVPVPAREGRAEAARGKIPVQPRGKVTLPEDLTVRDLLSALRAATHGADTSEILGASGARWEGLFATLLSVLVRKGTVGDAEFLEELRKI